MKKKVIIASVVLIALTVAAAWLTAAPSIGATTLAPASIEVGTTAPVTVTAVITDPSVIPTGVNLLRVGTTTTVLGQLKDDGLGGDAKAGDKIFTARVNVAGQAVGEIKLQVSAAFKGVLTRVTSTPILLAVAPKGVVLPPDPGEAGKATLAGIDADRDGVRDDIQRYIAFTFPQSRKARAAMTQVARAQHDFLLQTGSKQGAIAAAKARSRGVDCVYYVLGGVSQGTIAQLSELRAQFLNTESRTRAYFKADGHLGGQVFWLTPENEMRAACAFNPDMMEN